MATRRFADLSQYQRALAAPTVSPLDAALQGLQGGIQLQRLPQTIQENALAQQLQNALTLQKLQDLQNPEAAMERELRKFAQTTALKEAITNPSSGIIQTPAGLIGETIGVPSAIPQTAISLDQAIAANPKMAIPTAAPRLPITPIGVGNIQSGLSINQNVPVQAAQAKRDADLNELIQKLRTEARIKAEQPQSFTPGTTVGTIDEIRRGEGVKIPDKTVEPKPFSLSPGEKLFAPDGITVLAENPANSSSTRPITVSPGSVVIGADGKEIFRNPASSATTGKPLPKAISERISDAQSAIDNLITLKSYIDSAGVKSISGPAAGRTLGANPFSVTAQNFNGIRGTAKQVIGKYMEGGVLREADEKKYEKIIPGLTMLTETQQNQAFELYKTLKKKLVRDLDSYEKSGYDVSGLRESVDSLDAEFKAAGKSSVTVPEGEIAIVAPDGVSGSWPANKPIPEGFKLDK